MTAALITGAGQRLGRSIALALAGEGYAVAIHYNTSDADAKAVAAEIVGAGGQAEVFAQDLSDLGAAGGVVGRAADAVGPIGLLVNCASLYGADGLGDITPESWRQLVDVNAGAPVMLTQAFAAQFGPDRPAPEGASVINMLDVQLPRPLPGYFSYFCGKAALEMATRLSAVALAPTIRVNGVAPGLVLPSGGQTAEEFAARQAVTPLGAGLGADDIVNAVLYLANARHVTGQVLAVDSGQDLLGFGNADMAAR